MTEDPIKLLERDVGVWDAETVAKTPAGESRSRGTMRARIVGGRWLVLEFATEAGDFEGHGTYGWDPAKGCFVSMWVDTMRTFLATGEGHWDAAARTMTYHYAFDLPGHGPIKQREVTVKVSDDEQHYHNYVSFGGGPETEVLTVTYRRRR